MEQASLFDVGRRPPVRAPVDPYGDVVQMPRECITLPCPGRAWPACLIQIHPHEEFFMWAVHVQCGTSGASYQVGVKWGKFAHSRSDAIYWASQEARERVAAWTDDCQRKERRRVEAWLDDLDAMSF